MNLIIYYKYKSAFGDLPSVGNAHVKSKCPFVCEMRESAALEFVIPTKRTPRGWTTRAVEGAGAGAGRRFSYIIICISIYIHTYIHKHISIQRKLSADVVLEKNREDKMDRHGNKWRSSEERTLLSEETR